MSLAISPVVHTLPDALSVSHCSVVTVETVRNGLYCPYKCMSCEDSPSKTILFVPDSFKLFELKTWLLRNDFLESLPAEISNLKCYNCVMMCGPLLLSEA